MDAAPCYRHHPGDAMKTMVARLTLTAFLALTIALAPSSEANAIGRCDWFDDPALIAWCEAGGGNGGHGGIPTEWLEYGKGWRLEEVGVCPDGSVRVLRLLYWLDGDLWNSRVRDTDFGAVRFGPGDPVPYAPRRSDGTPAVFSADGLVPDIGYCVHPVDGLDLSAEISRQAPVGLAITNPLEGLTGLDTWLWYDGAASIPRFTLVVDDPGSGLHVEVEAWAKIERFTWDMGDGSVVRTAVPGSDEKLPASAAATYRYDRKGDYTITLTMEWTGTYRWRDGAAAPWSPPIPFPSNVATVTSSIPYHVVEIRSVLQP